MESDKCFSKNSYNKRQSGSSKSTQMVVYKATQNKKSQRRPVQKLFVIPRSVPVIRTKEQGMGTFKTCLLDPFHRDALGARMPDEFAFPTATFHSHGSIALVTGTGVTAGSAVLFPHPFLSYIDTSSGTYNNSSYLTGNTGQQYFSVNTGISGATTPAGLSTVLSEYRVVGVGWKIRVTMPELIRTGRMVCAPIPGCRDIPGYNLMNASLLNPGSGADYKLMAGIGIGASGTSNILNMPGAFQVSLNDMSTNDVLLRSKPISASYSAFHTTINSTNYNASYASGDSIAVGNVTGSTFYSDTEDLVDFSNLSGWFIYFEGLPITAQPVVNIEYIYHFEGLPALNASRSVPSASGMIKTEIDTALFNRVVDMAARAAWAATIPAGTSNLGVNAIAGVAGRLLIGN
jgi:hypothetical protein